MSRNLFVNLEKVTHLASPKENIHRKETPTLALATMFLKKKKLIKPSSLFIRFNKELRFKEEEDDLEGLGPGQYTLPEVFANIPKYNQKKVVPRYLWTSNSFRFLDTMFTLIFLINIVS